MILWQSYKFLETNNHSNLFFIEMSGGLLLEWIDETISLSKQFLRLQMWSSYYH